MNDAVIVSGSRTPVGRFGGAFKDLGAPDLGAIAIKSALEKPFNYESKRFNL